MLADDPIFPVVGRLTVPVVQGRNKAVPRSNYDETSGTSAPNLGELSIPDRGVSDRLTKRFLVTGTVQTNDIMIFVPRMSAFYKKAPEAGDLVGWVARAAHRCVPSGMTQKAHSCPLLCHSCVSPSFPRKRESRDAMDSDSALRAVRNDEMDSWSPLRSARNDDGVHV